MATNFQTLSDEIHEDPSRSARVERYRDEALEEIISYKLGELRRQCGLDQKEVAERLGMTQAGISALENSADPRLSTLRKLIEALGGQLETAAVFDDKRISLEI